jgi:hypothetical protein
MISDLKNATFSRVSLANFSATKVVDKYTKFDKVGEGKYGYSSQNFNFKILIKAPFIKQ